MNDGTADELKVSFPANETFTRIGRVTIAGLALRLGLDIAMVERLRLAVDTAVEALLGSGRIDVSADWDPGRLRITLANDSASIADQGALADQLAAVLGVEPTSDGKTSIQVESQRILLGVATDEAR